MIEDDVIDRMSDIQRLNKPLLVIILFGLILIFSRNTHSLQSSASHSESIQLMNRSQRTIIVDNGGTGNYTNIQNAIDNASSGDTVLIWAGTYFEQIQLNKTLTLMGNGSTDTTINGSYIGTVVTIDANWCNLSGFTITGGGTDGLGIFINSNFSKIENCSIVNNSYSGIYIFNEWNKNPRNRGNIISNCTCNYNGYGRKTTGMQGGIMIYGSIRSLISNCTSNYNAKYGMFIQSGGLATIRNSNICNNEESGIIIFASKWNVIMNCTISYNNHSGLSLTGHSDYNNITNNTFIKNNHYGIKAESSSNGKFYENKFYYNNNGKIQGYNRGGSPWSHNGRGNFWSDWIQPDSNNDGIVDFPYLIDGDSNTYDYFPLTYLESEDTDKDGYMDYLEEHVGTDIQNPELFPSDLDSDFVPDDYDLDRDGDGINNTEDLFPDDPDRWDNPEEEDSNFWFIVVILILIIVSVIIILGVLFYKRKTIKDVEGSNTKPPAKKMKDS